MVLLFSPVAHSIQRKITVERAVQMKKVLLLYALNFIVSFCQATEFLYPVTVSDSQQYLYVLYQKHPNNIELWICDQQTKQARQALPSLFNPADVQLVPGTHHAFSFIDDDIVRIKNIFKKSPRSLELDMPIYSVSMVHWVDSLHCYISGKYNQLYGIFQVNSDGCVDPVITSKTHDCMYPQKVGRYLFYIERVRGRGGQACYSIKQGTYALMPHKIRQSNGSFVEQEGGQDKDDNFAEHESTPLMVYDFGSRPIAFLYMASDRDGYVVEHQDKLMTCSNLAKFSYHRIFNSNDTWKTEELFVFEIPTTFLLFDSGTRLYESLLPLLPKHGKQYVYFSSTTQNAFGYHVNIFQYDLQTKRIEQKTWAKHKGEHYFCPCVIGDAIMYGGSLGNQESSIQMLESDDGEVRIDLPSL